jgi:lipid-binding SYLF domain-containing protein
MKNCRLLSSFFAFTLFLAGTPITSQANDLNAEVERAIKTFKEKDAGIAAFFDEAQGYAVFPSVKKGGFGVGGAIGDGEVFEKGKLIGTASLKQASFGFQLGGQVYMEVIFFKDADALESFKQSKFAVSAQVSAVAATEGASKNAKYEQGVAVFTVAKGGLMYEASVGGQKFKFKESK